MPHVTIEFISTTSTVIRPTDATAAAMSLMTSQSEFIPKVLNFKC